MNAREASIIHSQRRLLQRYGLRLSEDGWEKVVNKIRQGRAILLKKDTRSRSLYAVEIGRDKTLIPVVYSSTREAVVTVLPEHVIAQHRKEIDRALRKTANPIQKKIKIVRENRKPPVLESEKMELLNAIIRNTTCSIKPQKRTLRANLKNDPMIQLVPTRRLARYRLVHPLEKPFTRINAFIFFWEINGYRTIRYLQFCGECAVGPAEARELIATKIEMIFEKRNPNDRALFSELYIARFERALREIGLIWDQESYPMQLAA